MNMVKVLEIYNEYSKRALEEDYTNDNTLDICIACNDAIIYDKLKDTQADIDTYGEYTIRYNNSISELERLMGV